MTKNLACLIGGVSLTVGGINAATVFDNAGVGDGDLNNAANWTNGIPSSGNAGTTTADGTMSAAFSNGSEVLVIHSNISTGSNELTIGGQAKRLYIGDTASGSLTVNNGGGLKVLGTNQDVRIGTGTGGFGTLTFENGSTIDARKDIHVINGLFHLGSNVSTGQNGIQEALIIGDNGTLAFDVDGSFNNHTLVGNTLPLELRTDSTLSLNFAAAPVTGTTFDLINGVTGFYASGLNNVGNGGTGTGTFGNVNATGLGTGQSLNVIYNSGAGLLQVEVVPEPSSAALLGLGGLVLVLRRRK